MCCPNSARAAAAVGARSIIYSMTDDDDDDSSAGDISEGIAVVVKCALAGALWRRELSAATTSAMATSSISELDERLRALAPARVDAGARPDQGALFDLLAELAAATRGSDPREVKERQRSLEESLLRVACGEWAGPAVRRSAADVLAALFVVGANDPARPPSSREGPVRHRRSFEPLTRRKWIPARPARPPRVHLTSTSRSSHSAPAPPSPPPPPPPPPPLVSQATPWRCTRA